MLTLNVCVNWHYLAGRVQVFHMPFNIFVTKECFWAHFAHISPLSSVPQYVVIQMQPACIRLWTLITLERKSSIFYSLMPSQLLRCDKPLRTSTTFKVFNSCMGVHMTFVMVSTAKTSTTNFTLKWLCTHMPFFMVT